MKNINRFLCDVLSQNKKTVDAKMIIEFFHENDIITDQEKEEIKKIISTSLDPAKPG